MSETPVNPVGLVGSYQPTPEESAVRHRTEAASIACRALAELSQPWLLPNNHLVLLRDLLKKMVMELV